MKRYFNVKAETFPLKSYIEFEDDDPIRQVNVFDEEWVWASIEENRTAVMDQPLSQSGILPEEEITQKEFEEIWRKARMIGQRQSPDFFSFKNA